MSKTNPSNRRSKSKARKFPFLKVLLGAFALGIVLTASGFTFAATQEQRDSFCASCHTQPESTYYQRSSNAQAVDLASAHKPKNTRCIDCHSGSGIIGRVQAELLGAHNAFLFYTGTAVQPAKLTQPIRDESCLKCHQNVTNSRGRNNHFHAFLSRWQAIDPNAGACVSCHSGHTTDGSAANRFMNDIRTETVCEACHAVLRGGD
jgi:predicted CXXCH cytochrome family protein